MKQKINVFPLFVFSLTSGIGWGLTAFNLNLDEVKFFSGMVVSSILLTAYWWKYLARDE